VDHLLPLIRSWIEGRKRGRLGLITSIDGRELIALVLDPASGLAEIWASAVDQDVYRSFTSVLPQAHWFERAIHDLFGLYPDGHPRLKHLLLHEPYDPACFPLRSPHLQVPDRVDDRTYRFLEVKGEGIYELAVGPIHAGVIEPGHFRFSCLGETIMNLEIKLGYVHRGVEKRLTEVPWPKARFVAEAAASDTAAANALAHAIAIESLLGIQPSPFAQAMRTLALEIERLAMHIIDVGGMGTDVGFLGVSSSMGRLRGQALGMGQMLSGSRFLRGFIRPGGTNPVPAGRLGRMKEAASQLRKDLQPVISIFERHPIARGRFEGVGKISKSLAAEFGLVGVAARASGIEYDARSSFPHGLYPAYAPPIAVEQGGDILSRTRVRIREIWTSLDVIERVLSDIPSGEPLVELPDSLPGGAASAAVVEAFRGELIHLILTDEAGAIRRYAIKDPSFNNWTGISIAIRNNLIADFPLCNKSLSLSYSGNDL